MELSEAYDEALVWAAGLHRAQERKGSGIPYLSHLLAVSGLVMEHGGDEEQAIAGLLHDSIEDQGVTDAEIEDRFGARAAVIVRACTDADTDPKPPWRARKEAYIAHLATAPADALLVSLCDKVHNARTIAADIERRGEAYFDVFTGGPDGTRWYYRRLLDAFERRSGQLPAESDCLGGRSLLTDLATSAERIGATEAVAAAYDRAG